MLHDVAQARKQQLPSSHWTFRHMGRSRWRFLWRAVLASVAAALLYCLYVGILQLLQDPLPAIVITLLVPVSLAPLIAGGGRNRLQP